MTDEPKLPKGANPTWIQEVEKVSEPSWARSFNTSFTSWWERIFGLGVVVLLILVPLNLAYSIRAVSSNQKVIEVTRTSGAATEKNRQAGFQNRAIVCEQAIELGLTVPDICKDPNVIRYIVTNNNAISIRELLCDVLDRSPGGAPINCRLP